MKKLLVLTALMFVSACASGPIYSSNSEADYTHYNCTNRRQSNVRQAPQQVAPKAPQPIIVYEAPKPAPQPVVVPCNTVASQPAPQPVIAAQPCNGCAPKVQIVKEPVEIVYKKTTTTTVYEPKTTTDVAFEKEAIISQPTAAQTVVTTTTTQAPAPVVTPTVETISYTIDTTTNQSSAPIMSADEIK